jgi:hypothetical protein
VPSEVRKEQSTKLVEGCWTRPIQVDAQDKDVPCRYAFSFFKFLLPVSRPRFTNTAHPSFGTTVIYGCPCPGAWPMM